MNCGHIDPNRKLAECGNLKNPFREEIKSLKIFNDTRVEINEMHYGHWIERDMEAGTMTVKLPNGNIEKFIFK